ncbi:MAG: tetratricopeptide repeat protein [Pyrinomonadaceae bacterium]|nr:tetratricopeptide repeat protein [Pyrinomonadaceae bacterium]
MTIAYLPTDLEKILNSEFADPARVAVLAGAGISLDPPSRLPPAYPIMYAIIDALAPTPEIREALRTACRADRVEQKGPNNFLRMERLLSLIYHSDSMPRAIVELATAEAPNDEHFALARLASRGAVILTTNFDCLIERACQKLGLDWLAIVNDDDYAQLHSASLSKGLCLIIKLHGSADQPSSIQTTLKQVGRGRLSWNADQHKGVAIRDILTQRNLLVLGYSGSDDFDVVPALLQTPSPRTILWVEHDESKHLADAVLQSSDQIGAASKSGDVLLRMTRPRMSGTSVRDPLRTWRVLVATRELLQHWHGAQRTDEHALSDVGQRVLNLLREDCEARYQQEGHKWLDASVLFDEIQDLASAIACARQGRELAIRNNDLPARATFAAHLGRLVHRQGNKKDATQLLDEAQAIAEEVSDLATLSSALTEKSYILHQLGRIDEQIQTLEKVISIDRALGKTDWMAVNYGELAVALADRDFASALKYYQRGLELAREAGDMETELTLLNNFKLVRGMQANDPQVMAELERAEELAVSLGHLRGLVEVMGNRGMILSDHGDWDAALQLITRAEKLATSLDYQEGTARWKSEAADILRKRGKLQEAREMLESVLSIWNDLKVQRSKGTAHGRLGLVCLELRDYDSALKHFQAALKIDEAAGWQQGVVDDLGNLGLLFQETEHFDLAYQCFSQAVLKARASNYESALARNLGNLGMELSRKGQHLEALRCDEEALDINLKLGNTEGEAYTRTNLAGDLHRLGQVSKAVSELRKAYALAQQLGISGLAAHLKRVLTQMGYQTG